MQARRRAPRGIGSTLKNGLALPIHGSRRTQPLAGLTPLLREEIRSPSMSRWVGQEQHRLHVNLSVDAGEAHPRDVVEHRQEDSSPRDQAHGIVPLDRREAGDLAFESFAGADDADIGAHRGLFPQNRDSLLEHLVRQDPDAMLQEEAAERKPAETSRPKFVGSYWLCAFFISRPVEARRFRCRVVSESVIFRWRAIWACRSGVSAIASRIPSRSSEASSKRKRARPVGSMTRG